MRVRVASLSVALVMGVAGAATRGATAQGLGPTSPEVIAAVRAALAPALPFPDSDEAGALPADRASTVPWMIRPLDPGQHTIEILGNPLNPDQERRAAKAMAEIQAAIEAAQRRADAQYERALAEAQRTGRSQDIDGITLGDEGVAGARIDADLRLTIDVDAVLHVAGAVIPSSIEPAVSAEVPGAVAVVSVPANVYREGNAEERFCQAERWVFFGAFAAPTVTRRGSTTFEVAAAPTARGAAGVSRIRTLALRLRGNESLMADVIRRADWSRVRALVP